MAALQSLLPSKLPANAPSVFPPIGDDAPPPIAQAALGGGLQSLLKLPAPALPNVTENPRIASLSSDPLITRKDQLESDLYRRTNPVEPTSPLGRIGRVASGIGNVLGDIFAPATMALIPGTDLHNQRIEARDKNDLNQVSDLQNQEAQRAQTAANTAYLQQRPAIEQAKVLQKLTSSLAPKGIKATMNPDGTIDTEDDPDSQAFKDRVALDSYRGALQERAQIQADNQANHYVPGTPQYEENQRKLTQIDTRLHTALAGLGLQAQRVALQGQTLNFNEDKNYNPEPTATERKTGDLAQSAVNQVHTMRQIVQAHPEIFGPAAGRTTSMQAWLGSQSPDAQTFLSSSKYLADHSAGVFGSRSVEIAKSLEDLTNPKMNPDALNAALNDAESTAQHFVTAGTPHAKGQQGAAVTLPLQSQTLPKAIADQIPEGHQATLSDGSVWKKVSGKADRVK